MTPFRHRELSSVTSELHPFDDMLDWLAGLESMTRLTEIIQTTRGVTKDVARQRAKAGAYFASIAADFIESSRGSQPHIAFLPVYYAILNMAKLMISCTHRAEEVTGGIYHGIQYPVDQKESQSLFTEIMRIHRRGVFPLLY